MAIEFRLEDRLYVIGRIERLSANPDLTRLSSIATAQLLRAVQQKRRLEDRIREALSLSARRSRALTLPAAFAVFSRPLPLSRFRPVKDEDPSPPHETALDWIGISLDDSEARPYADEAVEVTLPDGSVRRQRTDRLGFVALRGVQSGGCLIRFPELDPPERVESKPTGSLHEFKRPRPAVKCHWEKADIVPSYFGNWPPSGVAIPDGRVAEDAKTKLEIKTKHVPDGTKARVEIVHFRFNKKPKKVGVYPDELVVRNGQVVRAEDGEVPIWSFESDHNLYGDLSRWFSYTVSFVYRGLTAISDLIEVDFLHVLCSDLDSDEIEKLGTGKECKEVAAVIDAATSHQARHYALTPIWPAGCDVVVRKTRQKKKGQAWAAREALVKIMKGAMVNAYSYYHSAHGNQDGLQVGALPPDREGPPIQDPRQWKYIDLERGEYEDIGVFPKALAVFSSCDVADGRIPELFLKKGTGNVIAFHRGVASADVRYFSKRFYRHWTKVGARPDLIPYAFVKALAIGGPKLGAELFGKGAKKVPELHVDRLRKLLRTWPNWGEY